MAGWDTVLVSNDAFSVSARPRSPWSWRSWRGGFSHIPFFVGRSLTFEFQVSATREPQDNEVWWQLKGGGDQVEFGRLILPNTLRGGRSVRIFVVTAMLPFSGEWQLTVGPNAGGVGPNTYVFNAVTMEGMLVKLIAPLLFGFASIGLGIVNACNAG